MRRFLSFPFFLSFFFIKQKALAARNPLPSPNQRATFPSRPRCTSWAHSLRGASPARQWVRGWPGSLPRAPGPIQGPQEGNAQRAGRGAERSDARETTIGRVGASPLGQEARTRRGEKGREWGSETLPGPGPCARPSPPHTHQHDGKSLLQFTWLGHRQLQRHAVRPEIGLLRIHAPRVAHVGCTPGTGAAPGPSRPRQKSERLPPAGATCPAPRFLLRLGDCAARTGPQQRSEPSRPPASLMLPAAPGLPRPLFLWRGRQGAGCLSACCTASTPCPASDPRQRVCGASDSISHPGLRHR